MGTNTQLKGLSRHVWYPQLTDVVKDVEGHGGDLYHVLVTITVGHTCNVHECLHTQA